MVSADADILIPAAASYLIGPDDAETISARYVVYGANNPFRSEGILRHIADAGVTVVPDFVANSGTALSYHTLVAGTLPTPEAILSAIGRHIRTEFDEAWPLVDSGQDVLSAFMTVLNRRMAPTRTSTHLVAANA